MFFPFNRSVLRATFCALALLGALSPAANAKNKATTAPAAKAAPAATKGSAEETVRAAVESVTGQGAVESIRKTPYGDLYEVLLNNGDIVYSDKSGTYVMIGSLFDIKAKRNITQERETELATVDISTLPLSQAIKQVKGNGKRILITFEDANCGYCKKLVKDNQNLKDVTIYTFLVPLLSPDSGEKAKNIWCSADRAKTWVDWMVNNVVPPVGNCENPVVKNGELSRKLRVKGTPTLFFADNTRIGGYISSAEMEKTLNEAEKNAAKAKK